MDVVRSPEIKAVARRVSNSHNGQFEAPRNFLSSGDSLRVLGFDEDESWEGTDDFMSVRQAQQSQSP